MTVKLSTRFAYLAALLLVGCVGAPRALAAPVPSVDAMGTEYRAWLDHGRTPARVVDFVRGHSPGFGEVNLLDSEPRPVEPGDRLLFVDRGRSVIMVVVGKDMLARSGVRMIAAHIDTPSPRLSLVALTRSGQLQVNAHGYGGIRPHHWLHRPLAVVGRVARASQKTGPAGTPDTIDTPATPDTPNTIEEIDIALGLDDDFALYATEYDRKRRAFTVITGSRAGNKRASTTGEPGRGKSGKTGSAVATLMSVLHQRYGLRAPDLQAAELYVVPRQGAREVGVDRALIGAHGQDDRANSYVAWRAIMDVDAIPRVTSVAWLIDREEVGSYHPAGATSQVLEMVFAYLLRAQGSAATEAVMARAFAASQVISADTPAGLNPNWPEVHDDKNAPVLGKGAALFPYTGHNGKDGGSAASAALVRAVSTSFDRAGAALQYGLLGRVDEGGGGTVAKHLAARGMAVVDIGVPVVSMHSPFELTAKDDLWAAYRGVRAWLGEP